MPYRPKMQSLCCPGITTLVFLFFLHFIHCTKDDVEIHHALSFRPSTIVASRWTAPGVIEVTKFPFSKNDKYTSYMSDAIANYYDQTWYRDMPPTPPPPPEVHDFDSARSIFEDAVRSVSQQLSQALDEPPIYDALYIPALFNSSSRAAAEISVFPDGRATKDGFKQFGFAAEASCRAYGLEECEALGRTSAECVHQDDLQNLIFVLEFEAQYLHVNLLEVYFEYKVFPSCRKMLTRDFGWESGRKMREDVGDETYHQKVYSFLYDFIEAALRDPTQQPNREDIRGIIVIGSASPVEIAEMQGLAQKAVGNAPARVFDTIDPSVVVAHGAAIYARDISTTRKISLEFMQRVGIGRAHDEL